ncbi:CC_3452 family protein [Sphingomonas corticis]|jgi:hypothetical protein|uniref:UrcA family protein n=1 Tax=Sphingomonas corticis TaxID=2722791 RepID=A0ABX1CIL2_9SPHN|nr:hypothetical protein [Sphingomonas corticis]NJR77839.1 hypothetical protein [Sphingomonas corticis]
MLRAVFSAVVTSAALLAAAGVQAQTGAYYVATPAAAPAKERLMTRATPWRLANGSFVAARAPERDQLLCQLVARDVGGLSAFSVGGKPYDAAALDKCNGKAGIVATAVAKN